MRRAITLLVLLAVFGIPVGDAVGGALCRPPSLEKMIKPPCKKDKKKPGESYTGKNECERQGILKCRK